MPKRPVKSFVVPTETADLMQEVAKLNGIPASEMIHRLAKGEAKRLNMTTVMPGWEVVPDDMGVCFSHSELKPMTLTVDEARDIADYIRDAALKDPDRLAEITTEENHRIVVTDKGRGVKIKIDDVQRTIPRYLALDLADEIRAAAKKVEI